MTATTIDAVPVPTRHKSHAISDAITIAWRTLLGMTRTPQVLVFSTIQPILLVLMFRYVFGGAIQVPGVEYVNYLMAGVFAQVVVFGAVQTGIGLAEDLQKGLIERFRSLPMARSAVLAGRTLADLVRNVFVVAVMVAVGFIVGWRVHTGVLGFFAGIGVLLLFGFAMTWVFAIVGMMATNAEAAQALAFPILFPLIFASSAFVPVETMPAPLEWFATHQPVSIVIDAVRSLTYGGQFSDPGKVVGAVIWSVAIVAVAAPVAVRVYRNKA